MLPGAGAARFAAAALPRFSLSGTPTRENAIAMISFGLRRVGRRERLVEGVTTLTITS